MPPAISICVPTRNRAHDLAVRLQELGHQTASDFEVVILDDGSTDATEDVARRAAAWDPNVRYVAVRPAMGMPAIIARCFAEARAPLVAIFHDHDAYRPDAVERLAAALAAVPDAPFAFCGVRTLEPTTGAVLDNSADPTAPPARDDIVRTFVDRGSSLVGASAVMVRKARLPPEPVVTPELGLFADVELWCRMALAKPAAYTPGPLVDVWGWREGESLTKLSWATIGRLMRLRLRFATELGLDRGEVEVVKARIRIDASRQRLLWALRVARHAGRSRDDLGHALEGAPGTVRLIARVVRGASSVGSGAAAR
jgi:glycosyltransferase involved in cell wall biosynthesis